MDTSTETLWLIATGSFFLMIFCFALSSLLKWFSPEVGNDKNSGVPTLSAVISNAHSYLQALSLWKPNATLTLNQIPRKLIKCLTSLLHTNQHDTK